MIILNPTNNILPQISLIHGFHAQSENNGLYDKIDEMYKI